MAIINVDTDKGKVYILVEEKDIVNIEKKGCITLGSGRDYTLGRTLVDENCGLCIIRGERNASK